jgi:hypothetical protein
MCCGQKRAALQTNLARKSVRTTPLAIPAAPPFRPAPVPAPVRPPQALPTPPVERGASRPSRLSPPRVLGSAGATGVSPVPLSAVSIRYVAASPIRVRGPVTGRHYEFSASNPVQSVDTRDASSLLQTRVFRRN